MKKPAYTIKVFRNPEGDFRHVLTCSQEYGALEPLHIGHSLAVGFDAIKLQIAETMGELRDDDDQMAQFCMGLQCGLVRPYPIPDDLD